jgi:transcriptional regulator with XRE-family HTH domain
VNRQIDLSYEDRRLYGEIIEAVGLTQKDLADLASVTQPWLSQVLKGRRTNVDSDMLKRVANVLADQLTSQASESEFPEHRRNMAFAFLSRFTTLAPASIPQRTIRPGGPVPADAVHYIDRDEHEQALEALKNMPFVMRVSGPVHCGKSTVLSLLERKARAIGVETAWFDPGPTPSAVEAGKSQRDLNATVAMALSELLHAQWNLERPPNGQEPDSIPRLLHWMEKELAPTMSKPRLLILDDLASLGGDAAEQWINLFVRRLFNLRTQLSIAVGLTYHFGPSFERWLFRISSLVHWAPRIELGWFTDQKVLELSTATSSAGIEIDLYRLFAGQPYLTHAGAIDKVFRDSVQEWEQGRGDPAAIRDTQWYKRHWKSLMITIMGPTLTPDYETRKLLKSFAASPNGENVNDSDHASFLREAGLIPKVDRPVPVIYRLMAEDFGNLVKG